MTKQRRRLPKYVSEYESPPGSGNWFVYFRHAGKRVRMRDDPYSPEFMRHYHALLRGDDIIAGEPSSPAIAPLERTFAWLCQQYMASEAFATDLDARTQRVRRQILQTCIDEPIKPGSSKTVGEIPLAQFSAKVVAMLRDRKKGLPEAANGRVKAVRQVFKWASSPEEGIALVNPARDVQYRKSVNPDGHHTWTVDEVERFEARHPVGSTARLALALLLYTGQRRSDIVALGRQHEKNGWLSFTQFKNRNKKPVHLTIPIRPELRSVLDASKTGDITYLVNELGVPFTAAGFGNWFHDRCVEAGVPGRAHGLRKAAATRLADAGATPHEIMAITGHRTLKEVDRYTRAANQRRLAAAASKRGVQSR